MTRPRAARAGADEATDADLARQRLRACGIVPVEPDHQIRELLAPGERVVAVRRDVSLERRKGWADPESSPRGDLYITTQRLVHLGRIAVTYPLCEIREAVTGAGALRLVVDHNHGLEIGVMDPMVLRVEIAGVREAARHAAHALTDDRPAGLSPSRPRR